MLSVPEFRRLHQELVDKEQDSVSAFLGTKPNIDALQLALRQFVEAFAIPGGQTEEQAVLTLYNKMFPVVPVLPPSVLAPVPAVPLLFPARTQTLPPTQKPVVPVAVSPPKPVVAVAVSPPKPVVPVAVSPPTPVIATSPPKPVIPVAVSPPTPVIAVSPPKPVIPVSPPKPVVPVAVSPPKPVIAVSPPTPVIATSPPKPVIAVSPPKPVIAVSPPPTPVIAVSPPKPVIAVAVSPPKSSPEVAVSSLVTLAPPAPAAPAAPPPPPAPVRKRAPTKPKVASESKAAVEKPAAAAASVNIDNLIFIVEARQEELKSLLAETSDTRFKTKLKDFVKNMQSFLKQFPLEWYSAEKRNAQPIPSIGMSLDNLKELKKVNAQAVKASNLGNLLASLLTSLKLLRRRSLKGGDLSMYLQQLNDFAVYSL